MDLSRLEILVKNNLKNIVNKTVLVIGLGGVGGYALESLVRCGIKKVIIVDGDKITKSNINRQVIAVNSNLGKYKVDAFETRIKDINPDCEVIKIKEFITKENIDKLFEHKIDYLIDAIDTIETKKLIIKNCVLKNINFITACGAGNRMDPSKIRITNLDKTSYDPIAKILRKYVKDEKINKKIKVVCSLEPPIKESKVGSNSFIPAIFGLMCTSYVIDDIIKRVEE